MASRDLLVTPQTPDLATGRALRVYSLIRALSVDGRGLDVLYLRFGADAPSATLTALPGVALRAVVPSRRARRAARYAQARLRGAPRAWARPVSPELVDAVRAAAAEPGRARVIADGPEMATALMVAGLRGRFVYNGHNLESAFRSPGREHGLGSARTLRAAERRILGAASESWMVSPADLAGARRLCPDARLRLAPNVIDTTAIAPVAPAGARSTVLMVADFSYAPNREAAHFLIDEVMPRAWAAEPSLRVRLVGRGLVLPVADERISAPGFVDDLAAEYAAAACAVVPLLTSGGTPFKFLEALAYGVPVVATPRAAAALDVDTGVHYLEADGAERFAQAIVEAARGGERVGDMAKAGRARVEDRYSLPVLARAVSA